MKKKKKKSNKNQKKKKKTKNKNKNKKSMVQRKSQKKKTKEQAKFTKKKKKKARNVNQRWGQFCPNIFSTFHSNFLSPIWRDCILKGVERKLVDPTTFLSPFPSQPNNGKCHFSPYFSLIIFHSPCFHPNQIYPKCQGVRVRRKCKMFYQFFKCKIFYSFCLLVFLLTENILLLINNFIAKQTQ